MLKEEFLKSVPENFSNDDFFELCKLLMDLSLNSEKIRFDDGKVGARFSIEGMSNASKAVKKYIDKYGSEEEALIRAVRVHAYKVVDDSDPRQKAYLDTNQKDPHVSGVLYVFTDIPENIIRKIVEDARSL